MHRHIIIATIWFLVGSAMHTLAQVDAIARAKNNPANSRMGILLSRWQTIVNRDAWALAFFVLILQGQFVALLNAIKVPVPSVLAAVLDLHVGAAISWMAGYLSDSALAFLPGLNTSLPPAIEAPPIDSATPKV
jgi:hypothetical protein